MPEDKILDEVISLQAYFKKGFEVATGLRKRLEGNPSAGLNRKGLTPEQKAELRVKMNKNILKNKKVA